MAVQNAVINGIQELRENGTGGVGCLALMTVTYTAYTSGDTATIVGVPAAITAQRRDGKTIALVSTRVATMAETGLSGTTQVYAGTFALSGNNITHRLENSAGTDTTFASGNADRPIAIVVQYTAT